MFCHGNFREIALYTNRYKTPKCEAFNRYHLYSNIANCYCAPTSTCSNFISILNSLAKYLRLDTNISRNNFLRIHLGRSIAFFIGQRAENRREKIKKLEGFLEGHSKDLVDEVLKKWFEPKSTISIDANGCSYSIPLASIYYEPHSKSRVNEPSEPLHLNYANQAIQHLEAKDYADAWDIWLEYKRLAKSHLGKVLKVWESIEEKLATNLPKKFTEWNARGISPPYCYILDYAVWEIFREAEHLSRTGEFEETSFKKDDSEKNYFRVGMATLYAKSSDESSGNEFIRVARSIITDKSLLEQLKLLDAEKEKIDSLVEKFKQALNKIIDDFEKGHINLKGTCGRCEDWYSKLIHLS